MIGQPTTIPSLTISRPSHHDWHVISNQKLGSCGMSQIQVHTWDNYKWVVNYQWPIPVYKTCTSVLPSVIVCRLTHCMHKISNTVLFCHLLPTTKHNTASRPSVSSFWNRSSVQSGINRRMYSVPVAEKCTHLSILTCYQLISPLSLNISKASQYICFWSRHTLQCWSYAWERRWEGQKGDKDINGNVSQLCGRRVATPALFVFRFCKTNEFTSL